MKKYLFSIFYVIMGILTFWLVLNFLIIPSLNQFECDAQTLNEHEEIIANDFEKIYLQDDYKICSSSDGIIVEITENKATLKCYYTADKLFINSEIIGPPAYVDDSARVVFLVCTFILCMVSVLIIFVIVFGLVGYIRSVIWKFKRRH